MGGRNPLRTSWDWWFMPLFMGVHLFQVAQDFVHPQYWMTKLRSAPQDRRDQIGFEPLSVFCEAAKAFQSFCCTPQFSPNRSHMMISRCLTDPEKHLGQDDLCQNPASFWDTNAILLLTTAKPEQTEEGCIALRITSR